MEAAFDERVKYTASLDSQYQQALHTMQKLKRTAPPESELLPSAPNSLVR